MEYLLARTDQLFDLVANHSPLWIYLFVLVSMTIENFFPPYPGDTAIFICGVYAAGSHASWGLIYFLSVIGTLISVMALYYIGRSKGRAIFASRKIRWLNVSKLEKLENWFARWGEKLLLVSRYLTGARALLALFAGVGNVRPAKMLIYSLISTLTWNFLVLYLALALRRDWQKIDSILDTYNTIIFILIAVVVIVVVMRFFIRKRRIPTR